VTDFTYGNLAINICPYVSNMIQIDSVNGISVIVVGLIEKSDSNYCG